MSNIISTETKEVEVSIEGRTTQVNIYTPKDKPYWLQIKHEFKELHDGVAKSTYVDPKSSPITIIMSDLLTREGDLEYVGMDGLTKTVEQRDAALIVKEFTNILRLEGIAKAESE